MYANHGLRKRDERQLALGLLSTMTRARVEAETITYNAAISTCDETRVATRIGLAQHDGEANLPVTVRLSVHTKRQEWQLALGSLSTVISAKWRRTRSVTMRPSAHAKRQEWQLALALLSTIVEGKVKANFIRRDMEADTATGSARLFRQS